MNFFSVLDRPVVGLLLASMMLSCTVGETLDSRTKTNEQSTAKNSLTATSTEDVASESTENADDEAWYCCVTEKSSGNVVFSSRATDLSQCRNLSSVYPLDRYRIGGGSKICEPQEETPVLDGNTETCCYYGADGFLMSQSHSSDCTRNPPSGAVKTMWTVGIITCPRVSVGVVPFDRDEYVVVPGSCDSYKIGDEIVIKNQRCIIDSASPDEDGCMIGARCQ